MRPALDEALRWSQRVHNHIGGAWAELTLAALELHGGEAPGAERLLRRVLEIGAGLNVTDPLTGGLIGMAALQARLGQGAPALHTWSAATRLAQDHNYDPGLMAALFRPWLGPLLGRQQEPELARALSAGQASDVGELIQHLVRHGLPRTSW